MKKILISITFGLLLLSITSLEVGAEVIEVNNEEIDITIVNEDISQSSDTVEGELSIMSNPKVTSNTTTFTALLSKNYGSTSTSRADLIQNYIYVKNTIFNTQGNLVDSTTDESKASTSITTTTLNGVTFWRPDYAIGNHLYRRDGRSDILTKHVLIGKTFEQINKTTP